MYGLATDSEAPRRLLHDLAELGHGTATEAAKNGVILQSADPTANPVYTTTQHIGGGPMPTDSIPFDAETPTLSPRQEAVALGVASGLSLAAAARKAKVGVPTAKTWSASLPAFRRRIQELRAEMTSQALGRLVEGMVSAADTLAYLCRKGKSEMVRLGAARALLELGTTLRESVAFEERLAALESRPGQRRTA
jgi:hypothetical protein